MARGIILRCCDLGLALALVGWVAGLARGSGIVVVGATALGLAALIVAERVVQPDRWGR